MARGRCSSTASSPAGGGFQHEENGADFALVLKPTHWGHGGAVTRAALNRGFSELGLDTVLIALPYTRNPGRVVARFGFVPDGEVNYGGSTFRQYRLDRNAWLDRCSSSCADTPRELV
jgi:RimJ/RimL family protein N-acetyltransferase